MLPAAMCNTLAILAIRSKPGKSAAITGPGIEPTMHMGSDRILVLPCASGKLELVSTGRICFGGKVFVYVT